MLATFRGNHYGRTVPDSRIRRSPFCAREQARCTPRLTNKSTPRSRMSDPKAARMADRLTLQPTRPESERQPATQETASKASQETGWDPYEVWRTRVLLPRLEDRAASETED
jgi:hypothetical protein